MLTQYEIERAENNGEYILINTVGINTITYQDDNAHEDGTIYHYRIRQKYINDDNSITYSEYSNTADLIYSKSIGTVIKIQYEIERSTNHGSYVRIATVSNSTRAFRDVNA